MTPNEVLQAVHQRYEQSTDYPVSGEEDYILRLAFLNDAVYEWEKLAKEGTPWRELVKEATITGGGTGSDDLPADFFCLYSKQDAPAMLYNTETYWIEKNQTVDGYKDRDTNIFWISGGKVHTNPALSSSATLPYIKKATRYTGAEDTDLEIPDTQFVVDYILAHLYAYDDNVSLYQLHATKSQDSLRNMMSNNYLEPANDITHPLGF
jgi:hypothetical protein